MNISTGRWMSAAGGFALAAASLLAIFVADDGAQLARGAADK